QHQDHPGPKNNSVLRQATQVFHPLQTAPKEDASCNHKKGSEWIHAQRKTSREHGRRAFPGRTARMSSSSLGHIAPAAELPTRSGRWYQLVMQGSRSAYTRQLLL
ncbi:unnamed protein product, partial [Ectocarpus sp. 8 AP-2014]